MAAEANYNNENLEIDPMALYTYATVDLVNQIQDYSAKLTDLTNAWSSMPSNWAGATAAEAQSFFQIYDTLGRKLFGTGMDNPTEEASGDAILPKIAQAVGVAAGNFDAAEGGVVGCFTAFTGSGPDTAPKDDGRRSPGIGPVTLDN